MYVRMSVPYVFQYVFSYADMCVSIVLDDSMFKIEFSACFCYKPE